MSKFIDACIKAALEFEEITKAKEKKMSKVIFENEEEFGIFNDNVILSTYGYQERLAKAKELGYIRKPDLEILIEESEKVSDEIGTFFSENDEPYDISIEQFNIMYNTIQAMKAELNKRDNA